MPALIVKVPAEVPNALALLIFSVPAFSFVPPVNVLASERVNVPGPSLVRA